MAQSALQHSRLTWRPYAIFLARLHRRQIVVHCIEHACVGASIAFALAAPILAVGIYRGWAVSSGGVAAIIGGGVLGALWGVATIPSKLATAVKADTQLYWNDLLSTSLVLHTTSSQRSWAQAVTKSADARCLVTNVSAVMVGKFGRRAWVAISLEVAVALSLWLLPGPAGVGAQPPGTLPITQVLLRPNEPTPSFPGHSSPRAMVPQGDLDEAMANRMGASTDTPSKMTDQPSTGADAKNDSNREGSAITRPGNGTGASSNHLATIPKLQNPAVAAGQTQSTPEGVSSGGLGASAGRGPDASAATGRVQADRKGESKPTPVWESTTWKDDRRHQMQRAETHEIPDLYQDMVRGYFDRP